MANIANSWNMFKMQILTKTDKSNLSKNVANHKKHISEKNRSEVLKHWIQHFMQNRKCFVIKCEPLWFGIKRSINNTILKKARTAEISDKISSRNSMLNIQIKTFTYHHHLQKYFLHFLLHWTTVARLTLSENILSCFSVILHLTPFLVFCGILTTVLFILKYFT